MKATIKNVEKIVESNIINESDMQVLIHELKRALLIGQ